MSLANAITKLNDALKVMNGIERWYDDPPEALTQFPCGLSYARSGELGVQSAGTGRNLHTIVVEIHHSRAVLPDSINEAKVWPDRVQDALYDDQTLDSSIDAIVWPVTYQAGQINYANETHYGVVFQITVKIMEALS